MKAKRQQRYSQYLQCVCPSIDSHGTYCLYPLGYDIVVVEWQKCNLKAKHLHKTQHFLLPFTPPSQVTTSFNSAELTINKFDSKTVAITARATVQRAKRAQRTVIATPTPRNVDFMESKAPAAPLQAHSSFLSQ